MTDQELVPIAHFLARRLWKTIFRPVLQAGLGDIEDVKQWALVAVWKSSRLYDPNHPSHANLQTFAWRYVRTFVVRRAQASLLVHVPARYQYPSGRALAARTKYGRQATEDADKFMAMLSLSDVGLDAEPTGSKKQADLTEEAELALDAVNRLHPRYRDVLIDRFGLFGKPDYTLEEIGIARGVSRERARQLVNRAIEKVRQAMR